MRKGKMKFACKKYASAKINKRKNINKKIIAANTLNISLFLSLQLETAAEAASSTNNGGGADASEFVYEICLYELSPERLVTQKDCPPLSSYNGVRLTRLKPRTDYAVAVRASLPGRRLIGVVSARAAFRTFAATPETPIALRLTNRGATFLAFSWSPATHAGAAAVYGYILEVAKVSAAAAAFAPRRCWRWGAKVLCCGAFFVLFCLLWSANGRLRAYGGGCDAKISCIFGALASILSACSSFFILCVLFVARLFFYESKSVDLVRIVVYN